MDDVFLMLDARDLRVDYASSNIEKLLGITEAQVREEVHVIEHLISGNDGPLVLDRLPDILPGEQLEFDREYIHQTTGQMRWFHVIAFCSDIQGEKKYILDMSDRTSDRKINQKLEEAVHTAENANLAKTIFLNNMSHDIRTPMNAIVGFTNIAMKHEPKPEVRGCLEKIKESADHLLTLINDVLDISRIESGKIKFVPVPMDITEVTDTVLSIMYGFLSNRDITFHTKLEEPETPYVLADAVRIREVLVNILGNAVKFTEDGGSITFETDPVKAVAGAQVVYTDIWVSMGEPVEVWQERIDALSPYQVNQKLMDNAAENAVFMHCLPAFHDHKTTIGKEMGEKFNRDAMEVTDEVFEGPQSIVFDEAENRMHTIKAVMAATL